MMEPEEDFDGLYNHSSSTPPSEDDEVQAQIIVFYPNRSPVAYKLYAGVNVIGRRSSLPERDQTRLKEWTEMYKNQQHVQGLFLDSSSVSSEHAAIYLDPHTETCFVKDLHSRNKTFLKQHGGHHRAIEPGKKCPILSGGSLTFGALRCRVSFGATFEGMPAPASTVARSAAVRIGRPEVNTGDESGPLDKCPSLQEWFCHSVAARRQSSPGDAVARQGLEAPKEPAELTHRDSFGFMSMFLDEDHTSSDPEPVTPRIDRPRFPGRARSQNASQAGLAPMLEDDKEGEDSDGMEDSTWDNKENQAPAEGGGEVSTSSGEDMRPEASQGQATRPMLSPAASLTEEEIEHLHRPIVRSPGSLSPLKRSRSGRQNPEAARSKSPRLQRGFAVREPSFRLEEMREAVSKIGTDA